MIVRVGVLAVSLALAVPALAQNTSTGCPAQTASAEPATKPAPASQDATAPGNAGSTGWTGGTGGSNIGTSPNGSAAQDDKQAATQPAPDSKDGTAPGNAGTTGWTGGLGGSNLGKNPNGTPTDPTSYQPAVARGIDPIKGMPATPAKC